MFKIYFVSVIIFLASCAPARFVKPIEKKELAVTASLGGPLFQNFGTPIPIPLTTLVAGYGLEDNLTVFGGIHPTAMSFGIMQTEFGVVKGIMTTSGWKPGISAALALNMAIYKNFSLETYRLWPAIDINAYWHVKQRPDLIYLGITNWIEPSSLRAHDEEQKWHWLPAVQAGYSLVKPKMSYTLEAKYIVPNIYNEKIVVEDVDFGGSGSLGIYIGITRRF